MSLRSLLACLLLLTSCSVGFSDDWKLQPLSYNNPGLEVDLGVGLWAWPMPLDYDGDGDIDLLVACPDKPSNGVYLFENPSQDPKVKMPTFLPAVRLGAAVANMQVSYVNGEPRILKNAHEFLRDSVSGVFDFAKPQRIFPQNNIHSNPVRGNMWRYVDYDGDGDHDLVVGVGDWTQYSWDNAYDSSGRWRNGPLHGHVYWIENRATDESPEYSDRPEIIHAAGAPIDVYGWPSPNFADFDNDGDLDLLCGEFLDGFTYFENIGSREKPIYAAGQKMLDPQGNRLVMHLQMITPTALDWDSDGDLDLIVGDEDGRVALIENTGQLRGAMPIFEAPKYFQQQADTLKFGALATPFAYDWDGDGDEDILCGNTAGNIALFENLGQAENGLPQWEAPRLLHARSASGGPEREFRILALSDGSIQGPCEAKWGYTTLSVADWDSDGHPDILYNSILAQIGILKNESGKLVDYPLDTGQLESPPKWYWWQTKSSAALTQWRTTPVAVHFDDDDQIDLVMLDQEGYLTLRSADGPAQRIFVDENNRPLRLNSRSCGGSGRVKLAVVDWDSDGRLDILTNSENAVWYRNCEARDGFIVLKKIGNLADRNVAGHTSSPAACDFDQDQKPDLLVGAEDGRLYFIAHDDCISYSSDQLAANPPEPMQTPKFASWQSDAFIFEKAPFAECHASTLCETNRGLVAAWFGGTKEKNPDVGIWTSYHDGEKWSSPREVANGIQHEGLRYPCWNPVLFQPPGDAPTLLFFKVGPSPSTWWGEMMVSYDRGRSFVEHRRLPEGIDGPVRCQPILLPDGKTLLSGGSTEHDGWTVHFESIELKDGQPEGVWSRVGPVNSPEKFSAIQPTFLTHADGRIQVLCRTRESVITTSFSADQGKTWSEMEAIALPNPNSGIDAITLADGRHLLIYNPLGSAENGWGGRSVLSLAVSSDGLHWNKFADVEREQNGEFSYPSMIQAADGYIHLSYTWKRQKIKHVILDPAGIPLP